MSDTKTEKTPHYREKERLYALAHMSTFTFTSIPALATILLAYHNSSLLTMGFAFDLVLWRSGFADCFVLWKVGLSLCVEAMGLSLCVDAIGLG